MLGKLMGTLTRKGGATPRAAQEHAAPPADLPTTAAPAGVPKLDLQRADPSSLAGAKTGWFDCSSIGIPTIHRYRRFLSSSPFAQLGS